MCWLYTFKAITLGVNVTSFHDLPLLAARISSTKFYAKKTQIMMTGTSISSNLSNYKLQSYYKLQEFDGELIGILDDIDIEVILDNIYHWNERERQSH